MSDPVTNSEVEDVLSSIRRLVGANKRSNLGVMMDPGPDRLVLTPQLRVSDHAVLRLDPADAIPQTEGWYEFEEPPLPDPLVRKDTGAQAEDFRADQNAQSEDIAKSVADANTKAGEGTDRETLAPLDMSEFRMVSEPKQPKPDYSQLTAKIAALESAIARTQDQWEPDAEDEDAYAGTRSPRLSWQNDVELDGRGAPVRLEPLEPSTSLTRVPPETADTASDDDDTQVIEEDALRDLVADIVRSELRGSLVAQIVRQELQGDLGERITRNVRKLVRREIQRALTARDLD